MASMRMHFDRRKGGLGRITCMDGFLLLPEVKGVKPAPDPDQPCPLCNATLAAKQRMGEQLMLAMIAAPYWERNVPRRRTAETFIKQTLVMPDDRPDMSVEDFLRKRDDWQTTKLPEGVMSRVNREGKTMHDRKTGLPLMTTVDFRSDTAVTNRMLRSASRHSGRVTGSTSTCGSWAVPAKPGDDRLGNSDEVLQDLRSTAQETTREAQRNTPRKGKRKVNTDYVRRYVE